MKIKLSFLTTLVWLFTSTVLSAQVTKRLYGTTYNGGEFGYGVIYSVDLDGKDYQVHHQFNGDEGGRPVAAMIQSSNGKLFGTTKMSLVNSNQVGGSFFVFDPKTNTFKMIYEWDGLNSKGANAIKGSLMQASNGRIYGVSSAGGNNGYGTIFSFDPNNTDDIIWYDFPNTINEANGSLIEYNGKLWGTSYSGGSKAAGALFSLDFTATTPKVIVEASMDSPISGSNPYGGLVLYDKKLYGVNSEGGASNEGTIFSYDFSSLKIVYNFQTPNSTQPQSSLIEIDGVLYGTTKFGGSANFGTIYTYDITQSKYTKIEDFNGKNGSYPFDGLVRVNNDLFGVTTQDDKFSGVLFKCSGLGNGTTFNYSYFTPFIQGTSTGYEPTGKPVYVELCSTPEPSSVSLLLDKTQVCSTTDVVRCSLTYSNIGATPIFEWYINNVLVNTTSYSSINLSNNAPASDYKVRVVTDNICSSSTEIVSNIVTVKLVAGNIVPPKVTLSQANNVNVPCNNSPVVFTATPEPTGVYEYRWFVKKNTSGAYTSVAAPSNVNTLTYSGSYLDTLRVEVNELCSAIGGDTIQMNYSPIVQYNLDLTADRTIVCENDKSVKFTALVSQAGVVKGGVPIPAGTTFKYQWFVNNVLVYTYTDSRLFDTLKLTSLNNNDKVFVRVTSNNPCITSATNNFTTPITINVNQAGVNNLSAVLFTLNNKVCSSSSTIDFTIIPNGFKNTEISSVRLIRKTGLTFVSLNDYSFTLTPVENEIVYAMIDVYNSCGESYTITTNKINIQVSPYICSGFPAPPESSITGPKSVNLGETQNYAITLDSPADTVFTKGVPLKFDWYYEITDKGVKKYYQAFVINNVLSGAPLGSNVFVSFPGNFKQGKLVSVSSMYRLPNNEYIPFDTNYYDVEVKAMPTITNALCSDSIGCSAYRIEQIKIANYTFNQAALSIECPRGSRGYSDFTKAEFVYSDTLGNLYSLVNSYPEMYAGSTVNVSVSGKDSAQYYAFWADINGDGDFTDANEFLGASSVPMITYNGTLTLPFLDGTITSLRLRVRSSREALNTTDYCGTFLQTKGETEDYLVSLVPYPTLEAPQAFTPGSDGLNDYLVIRGVDVAVGPLEIKVYDKLGNLIYQNKDYQNDWNGYKSDGSKYNNGTYYITATNGSRSLKAYVELINESSK